MYRWKIFLLTFIPVNMRASGILSAEPFCSCTTDDDVLVNGICVLILFFLLSMWYYYDAFTIYDSSVLTFLILYLISYVYMNIFRKENVLKSIFLPFYFKNRIKSRLLRESSPSNLYYLHSHICRPIHVWYLSHLSYTAHKNMHLVMNIAFLNCIFIS